MNPQTVELPCKIGDVVWAIRDFMDHPRVLQGIVSEMLFTADMRLCIVVRFICRGEWGKVVFATEEEARQAIAERMKNNEGCRK